MRTTILLSAFCAATALAAPKYPDVNINAARPASSTNDLSEYFNLLAQKISAGKQMAASPVCDLSKAVMPVDTPTALPAVTAGLVLKHVAIGRGTQNYTCDLSNTTAPPVAVGAVATLFNATCVAATYPDILNTLPRVAMSFNLSATASAANLVPASTGDRLAPGDYTISGHHFFLDSTTPFFTLDTQNGQFGQAAFAKNASSPAPAGAATGQRGEAAVPWLKLMVRSGTSSGGLQETYRVETAGGSAPATCEGQSASFEVQYSAQYWFYEST